MSATPFQQAAMAAKVRPPSTFGRYVAQAELGRGGMGAVYRAVEEATGRVVALKTLERTDELAATLFEREYHTLASLRHPCVIEVYDFGVAEDGRRYYTMELLDGQDLGAISPLPWRKACEHLRDVATSLALLHTRRLVHRDVGPRNVRLDSRGRAKLIDFGALAAFGAVSEIAGTPFCMAPEVVRRCEIDHRSDLFSLGVLAYGLLTGEAPYRVRHVDEAETVWRTAPPAPSKHVPDIPHALDQLVLSLLSLEPLGRPASAAEVTDRLCAIAELDEEPLAGIPESHLLSSVLVGRERERAQLRQQLKRTCRGQGGLVFVEGSEGLGRSRLANELSIEGRLAGMVVLHVNALAHREPSGTLRVLAETLSRAAPAEASETLARHLPVLGQVFPALNEQHSVSSAAETPLPINPSERRSLVQTALASWFLEVAERRPMLVVVDDAHAVDADSVGVLVVLADAAQRSRLMVLATCRLDAQVPVGIRQLARVGARIALRNLDREAVERLVASMFGDVPHRARLSEWLHSVGHGNPAQSLELVRHLVARKVIRYEGGAWVLPAELSKRELPATMEEALAARICALSPLALRLARLLAMHRGVVSLPFCRKLLPEVASFRLYGALDELTACEMLVASGDDYRLGQEALRAALMASLEAEQVQELHLTVGRALEALHGDLFEGSAQDTLRQATVADLGIALQAGWHFLRGGEAARGRDLLRNAGIELTHRGDGLTEAVPALQAALAAYRKEGRSRFECVPLMVPLTLAGAYADWRLSYRHGEELLDMLCELTGIGLARRLERWVGGYLALAVSVAIGFGLYHATVRRRSARSFREAFLGLISLGSAIMGTCAPLLDRDRAQRVMERLRPLRLFSRRHAVGWVHGFLSAVADATAGRYAASWSKTRRAQQELLEPGELTDLPEEARVQLESGLHLLLGGLQTNRTDGTLQETLAALDRQRTSVSRQTAAGLRAIYYANRGERPRYAQFQQEVDVLAAQAGSTWRQDVLMARTLWWPQALCEDVMGLKRTVRQLEELASEVPSLAETRDAARACYLAERGMHVEALTRYQEMFEAAVAEPNVLSMRFVGAYARLLRAVGRSARAKEVCESALARLAPQELEFTLSIHGALLELALAMADLGETAQAEAALDGLLREQNAHDNPLIHGLTHKARARVALLQRDSVLFERHLWSMQYWFERTGNPALVAQCQKLLEDARAVGLSKDARTAPYSFEPADAGRPTAISTAFKACRTPGERLQTALGLIVERTHADRGYLYLLESDVLRFAAPVTGLEPPEELFRELMERRAHIRDNGEKAGVENISVVGSGRPSELRTPVPDEDALAQSPSSDGSSNVHRYWLLWLTIPASGQMPIVGAVALVPGEEPLQPVDSDFLVETARRVHDAGDIQTVYLGAPRRAPSRGRPEGSS